MRWPRYFAWLPVYNLYQKIHLKPPREFSLVFHLSILGQNEVKGRVRVAHNQEQGRFAVAQGVQLHFVGFHQLTDFPDVKGR